MDYVIKRISYKRENVSYARLCLGVRCPRTGEQFQVNGYSDVGIAFYKPSGRVRFNRAHVDKTNNLTKGLLEPVEVTSTALATAMRAAGHPTTVVRTVRNHFCWDTILSKALPENVPPSFDPDHWLAALAVVYPCVRYVEADNRGRYCVNDEVVGLKRFLTDIGVYYTTRDIYNIIDHMSFNSREDFVSRLDKLVEVSQLTGKKIIDLVNAVPSHMITPETRRLLRILAHVKEHQSLTGSIYVPLPPPVLWNENRFPRLFYEKDQKVCLVNQREDEARFVRFIMSTCEHLGDEPVHIEGLNEQQTQAVHNALRHGVSLVDGPPGSGKTFVTKQIVTQLAHANVYFIAPTGKAVYRLKESVGGSSGFFYTIHKLYYASKQMKNPGHEHWDTAVFNAPNVFVVDESSMLGNTHMNLLWGIWQNIEPSKIIFIGDTNQLPPIDPGDLFRDFVLSHRVPRTTLTERFRQGNVSNALMDAIIDVENRRVPTRYDESFQYVCLTNDVVDHAHALLMARGNPTDVYNELRTGKIMVISSRNDTVSRLSEKIRATLVSPPGTHVCERDLVRCNANVYNEEYNLMRGTPGVVVEQNGLLVARYEDGNSADVEGPHAVSVDFNYAITCHKAQGSEADHVIFVLEDSVCAPLHKRNLLYTAMTRAKRTLTIVGPMDVLKHMVANDPVKRCTTIHEHFFHDSLK